MIIYTETYNINLRSRNFDFMEINKLHIPTLFNDTKSHMKCFKEEDYSFQEKWLQYHKDNAILHIFSFTPLHIYTFRHLKCRF